MTTDDNTPNETLFDFSKKKKKRTNRDALIETVAVTNTTIDMNENETTNDASTVQDDYTYEELITRAFNIIHETNPRLDPGRPQTIILPLLQLALIGAKRTSFLNFGTYCKLLKRQEKHLYDYIITELGTKAAIDANHALVIRGRFKQIQIESIVRSYIKEYVICKTCHSLDTLLGKSERLTVLKCNICHSQYCVSSIKTGFQAQITKRSKAA